jgi:hypothetical protein
LTDELTPTGYRDAFRECLARLLDYELGRPPRPASAQLQRVIELDAKAQVAGH